jgi:hypothetical protein
VPLDPAYNAGIARHLPVNSHQQSGWLDLALQGRKQKIRSFEVAFFKKTIAYANSFPDDYNPCKGSL